MILAKNGKEVIDLVKQYQPDLIVMDIQMSPIATSLTSIDLKSAIIPNPLVVNADLKVIDAITQMSNVLLRANAKQEMDPLEVICQEARASCVLVIEAAKVIGIITERDVVRLSA
ncbi:MAG: CBS domain-containing protein, partial [Pseudanabaena sp.]